MSFINKVKKVVKRLKSRNTFSDYFDIIEDYATMEIEDNPFKGRMYTDMTEFMNLAVNKSRYSVNSRESRIYYGSNERLPTHLEYFFNNEETCNIVSNRLSNYGFSLEINNESQIDSEWKLEFKKY